MGPARAPIVPLPRVTGLQLAGGGQAARLELTGEDFAPGLQVWFGEVEADTVFRSAESVYCLVPDIQQFCTGPAWTAQPGATQVTVNNTTQHIPGPGDGPRILLCISTPQLWCFLSQVNLISVLTHILRVQVLISLVRQDGVIFPTGLTFTFTPEPGERGAAL